MCSSPTLADSKYVTRLSERGGGADEKKRTDRSEQPFFCHPSWILLRFSRWLCAYVAVHYTQAEAKERGEKKSIYTYIHTYICWYKAVFSRLSCVALVGVQDTIVWAFAEPCNRDAWLYCIYLYYFWKAVKWR